MSDTLILFGALALAVERWTELWMNALKAIGGEPPEGQNFKQFSYRAIALLISSASGVVVTAVGNLDFFKAVLPDAGIQNGLLLSGIILGLGAAPAHEIVKYIEEKKNKGKAEKAIAQKQAGLESPSRRHSPKSDPRTETVKSIAVPQSVKGSLAQWYGEQLLENTRVLHGSVIGWVFGMFRQAAVTIHNTVHLTPKAPDLESVSGTVLLGHEYVHVLQQQEMGWWSFLTRYVWHWRPRHIRQGWKHPLEEPAYARGEEIRRALES